MEAGRMVDAVEVIAQSEIVDVAGAVEIVTRPEIVDVAGAIEVVARPEIVDVAARRLANVADEEDAVDVADLRRVSTRIYRISDGRSMTGEPPSATSMRWRTRSTE